MNVEELRAFKRRPGLPLYSPAVFDYHEKPSIPRDLFAKGRPDRKTLEIEYTKLGLLTGTGPALNTKRIGNG